MKLGVEKAWRNKSATGDIQLPTLGNNGGRRTESKQLLVWRNNWSVWETKTVWTECLHSLFFLRKLCYCSSNNATAITIMLRLVSQKCSNSFSLPPFTSFGSFTSSVWKLSRQVVPTHENTMLRVVECVYSSNRIGVLCFLLEFMHVILMTGLR